MFIFIENDAIINSHYIVMAAYYFAEDTEEHLIKFVMSVKNIDSDKTFYKKFDTKDDAILFLSRIR